MPKKFKIKSEKPKQKWKIFNCTDETEKETAKGAHTEIFGNREIILEGCMGVFEYSDTYLKLKLQKGALILCGCGFDIITFEGSTIVVKGKISSLEFCI